VADRRTRKARTPPTPSERTARILDQWDDALAKLRRRWAAGHTHGCVCHGRPGRGCPELRRVVLDAGMWREIQ